MKIYSYAPTTGDHTYEVSSGNRVTYTLEQAIALGYPIAEQFKGQKNMGPLPKEWQEVVEDALMSFDKGFLDNVPPSEYIQNIANALYALTNRLRRELTDVEIREVYSEASMCSYDAVRVMAGYRAIIAADRKLRGEVAP